MTNSFRTREDRLKPYLESVLKEYVFTEVSPEFLDAAGLSFMKDVAFPVHVNDVKSMAESGLSATRLADNIAMIIGCDTQFRYADKYVEYLGTLFDHTLLNVFCSKGEDALGKGDYKHGAAYLRAAMMTAGDSLQAMFSYALGCRFWYLNLEGGEGDPKLVSILKSEAGEYFETITTEFPDFAKGWYFLGYSYVNQAQYQKAQICWKHYLTVALSSQGSDGRTEPEEDMKEIRERLSELEDPVKIETGINLLMSGQTVSGLKILEPYVDTGYNNWWPLHFHLAEAYRELGHLAEAEEGYLRVLKLAPSNADAMERLSELYEELGDTENAEKYRKKAAVVRN